MSPFEFLGGWSGIVMVFVFLFIMILTKLYMSKKKKGVR